MVHKTSPSRDAVVICTDRRMLIPALFVANGAARMRTPHSPEYDVLLVARSQDIDDSHRHWMQQQGIGLVDDLDFARIMEFPMPLERFSPAALYRLLVPGHLASRYDKLLYLDSDVEVRKPVSSLFSLNLGENAIAAAPSVRTPTYSKVAGGRDRILKHYRALGMTPPFNYFNTGVLLIDNQAWIRDELESRTIDFLIKNVQLCTMLDESAFNGVLDHHYTKLSPVWNFRAWCDGVPGTRALVDPAIVHFDGPVKPWQKFGKVRRLMQQKRHYQKYRQFLSNTPWEDWLSAQWTGADLLWNLEFECVYLLRRMLGRRAWRQYSEKDKSSLTTEFAQALRDYSFADVEQGLTRYQNGRLQLA